jgi:hypothetical protein
MGDAILKGQWYVDNFHRGRVRPNHQEFS